MTDRGLAHSDAATACPFVAFEDDRDERSDRPDHRHRCYADVHPAPRAIAHQEAYCLSAAFAVCPTFQDWAQREAARARGSATTGTGAGHAARDAVADRAPDDEAAASKSAERDAADDRERDRVLSSETRAIPAVEWQGSRPNADDDDEPPALPPRRNPPRDWAAPPPWAGGAAGPGGGGTRAAGPAGAAGAGAAGATGAAAGAAGAFGGGDSAGAGAGEGRGRGGGTGPDAADPPRPREGASGPPRQGPSVPPPFLADRASRGLAGSAADRLAGGAEPGDDPSDRPPSRPPDRPQASQPRSDPFVPSRSTERAQAADEELAGLVARRDRGDRGSAQGAPDHDDRDAARYGPGDTAGVGAAGAAGAGAAGATAGAAPRRPPPQPPRGEEDAPHWEQPRRFEAYPTIKTRGSGGKRLGVMAAALGIAALGLFLLPAVLNWFGDRPGTGTPGGVTTSPSPSIELVPSASPEPATPAAPTPQVYVIKSGDTLSKIAQQFNVSLDDLLEANRENIPDPDMISIGDQVIIPVPGPDEVPGASAAAS